MVFESMGAKGRANQPQGQAVNRSRHAPHRAVAAFANAQFYPCRQDGLAHSHGRLSFLQAGRGIHKTDTGWPRGEIFELHTAPQRMQRRIVRLAFYLPPIGLEQIEARVTEARLQSAAKGQQKNSSSNANSGRRSKSASRWCVSFMA